MTTVTLQEAQSHFKELIARAERGEAIVITQDNQPKAKLVPISKAAEKPTKRVFGQHRGEMYMSEDFDEPLPDEFWLGSKVLGAVGARGICVKSSASPSLRL